LFAISIIPPYPNQPNFIKNNLNKPKMESYIKSAYVAIGIHLGERKVPPILDMYHVQRKINGASKKIK
jgi:hypothetical protein